MDEVTTSDVTMETALEPSADATQPESIEDFISSQIDAAEEQSVEETPPEGEAQETATPEGDTEPGDEPESTDEPVAEETTDAPEAIQPPQSMSAKDREAFHKLSPEQQQWISDRDKQMTADYTRKTMEVAEKAKTFDKLEQIIAPRRQGLALAGMDDSTAIGQLFAYSDFAEQDPVGFARYLLEQRGIPLSAINEPGQQTDPQLAATQQKLEGVIQFQNQQQAQQREQQEREISTVVDDFAKDTAYEHYSELEQDMIPIVASLRQTNPSLNHRQCLEKAYRMALAANEDVSAKVEADRKAKEESERIKKAKEDAAKAKKASATNMRSSPSLPSGAVKAKSVDEFVGALYDERAAG